MFALVDCNNFFASCERLFRPDLWGKPVVVLSNNDGCVIARSNEAKNLGIKMGEPYFKVKALCNNYDVHVFSSNYELYGDMSERVMATILSEWHDIEIYSIDEVFINLQTLPSEKHDEFCQKLQKKILMHTGIPTSIGIGTTKTLAKAANYLAKRKLKIPVFNLNKYPNWLKQIDVCDVWGVGRKCAPKLKKLNILTAQDLAKADIGFIRKKFNIVMQRTALELNGTPCMGLEDVSLNKSVLSSRSFGSLQTEISALKEAVSSHIAIAINKIRKQNLYTKSLTVFILSNKHRDDLEQYQNSISISLITPSDSLFYLTKCAKECVEKIYKPGIFYKKAGIRFDFLTPKSPKQGNLFYKENMQVHKCHEILMQTMGKINNKFGKKTIHLAAEGINKKWAMKRELKSPSFTTNFHELPIVYLH